MNNGVASHNSGRWGSPVINPEHNAAHLAEALAKLEGFSYAPSETHWWRHGHSSERDFIYVTAQNLSAEQLQALSDEVGPERSLLVCCAAFHGVTAAQAAERWPNLTLTKIPKMVLARCEWGHDDYSLNVANLPMAQPTPEAPLPRNCGARERTLLPSPSRGEGLGVGVDPPVLGKKSAIMGLQGVSPARGEGENRAKLRLQRTCLATGRASHE